MVAIKVDADVFNGVNLGPGEEQLLRQQLFTYVAPRGSFLHNLFTDNFELIKAGLQVAKAEFNEQPFRGMYAWDSEIGMQLIRPGYVLRTTGGTEAVQNDWTFTFTSGNDYWIGFSTNNQTAINIDKRILVIPMAIGWTQGGNPSVEEIYVQLGGTTYPVNVIRHGWFADNGTNDPVRVARIRPQIWKPKARPLVQVWSIAAQTQEMMLLGLCFGLGDLLRQTTVPAPQT